jgi:hypothetical protein
MMIKLTTVTDARGSDEFQQEIRQFVGLLESAATYAYSAVQAIAEGDDTASRSNMDLLRHHNVEVIATRDRLNKLYPGSEPAATDAQVMSYALEIFRSAEQVVHEWIMSNGQAIGRGETVEPVEYWHRNIDLLLPALWDFDSDIFVVKGNYDETLMAVLQARQQKRVLFFGAENSEQAGANAPVGCAFVESQEQLRSYVATLVAPLPARFVYLSLNNEQVDLLGAESFNAVLEKSVMVRWMELNTRNAYSRRWVDQGLKNLPLFAHGKNLKELDGLFKGKPAILIAPGPSLEKNIHLLKEAKGRAVLIAQLQSVRRLYKAGVQPDFVVVLDPQDLTAPPFNNLQDVPDEFLTNLVVGVTCHPAVIRRFKSVFYFGGGGGVDRWLQTQLSDSLRDLSGNTTAVSCLRLALDWTCSPIIMVGQDLSVSEGRRYAGDSTGLLSSAGMRELPGFYGDTVKSPANYYMFHFAIEMLAKEAKLSKPDIELLNCTEGGAYVEGFAHISLQEALSGRISKYPLVPDWKIPAGVRDRVHMKEQRGVLHNKVQEMIGALDMTVEELSVCEGILRKVRSQPECLPELNAEEAKMKALLKRISIFSIIFEKEIAEVIKISKSARSLSDGLNVSETLYRLILQGCEELRPSLVGARDVLDEAV